MISHSHDLLNKVDRLVCRVMEGIEIDPEARRRLIEAREAITRMLNGRITKDTDHSRLWGELNAMSYRQVYTEKAE